MDDDIIDFEVNGVGAGGSCDEGEPYALCLVFEEDVCDVSVGGEVAGGDGPCGAGGLVDLRFGDYDVDGFFGGGDGIGEFLVDVYDVGVVGIRGFGSVKDEDGGDDSCDEY